MKTIATAALALFLSACATSELASRSDDRFALVRQGMTRDDVLRLLGRPDETMRFPLSGNEAWDYRYMDTWGYFASYSVTLGPDSRVLSSLSHRLNDGGDHGQ
jgi:outer membrane protein assembly factor BamE (lipoprotein component of BamABCDE complex)